ncbi:MAG: hypothetical protein K6L74_15075 [Neptuniibacter sp.]
MTELLDVFENQYMQVYLLGPLAGVVLGALFSGLSKPLDRSAPSSVVQTRNIFIQNNYNGQTAARNDSDGREIVILGAILLAFLCWKYAHHAEFIQKIIFSALVTLSCFFLSAAFVSLMKGFYTGKDWWIALGLPAVSFGCCIIIFLHAIESYDPVITQLAYEYPLIQFYTQGLSNYGMKFLITHVIGITMIGLITLVSSFSLLNYLSLMNQRQYGYSQSVWIFFARISFWATGGAGLCMMLFFNVIAFLLIYGYVTSWLM